MAMTQPGALHGEQPHRATAPHGHGLSGPDVGVLGGLVARRRGVRGKQQLLIGVALGGLERAHVGLGHAHILGKATGIAAEAVGVAEEAGRRLAVHLLQHPGVGVGVVAPGGVALSAEGTMATGHQRRHDDAVARLHLMHLFTDLNDLAHELVADDVAFAHGDDHAVIEV